MNSRSLRILGRFGRQILFGIVVGIGKLALSIGTVLLAYGVWILMVFCVGKLGHFVAGFTPLASSVTAKNPEMQTAADGMLGIMIVVGGVLLYALYVVCCVVVMFVKESWAKATAVAESSNAG